LGSGASSKVGEWVVRQELEIGLVAIDEASDVVAAASKRISDSVAQVSNSQKELADAVSNTLPPLSESEQAQMNNASAALQLNSAQTSLRDAQQNLNRAITEYGADSSQAASALRDLNAAQANVSSLQKEVGMSTQAADVSMRSFTTGISGVATASFSLYGAYDRINESEISLDRSNLMVKTSTKSVEDAQRALSTAIVEHGISSQEATTASDSLSIAQDRLSLANERAQQAQENVNKSIMSAALQIIPTSITMVDSLSRAWNNFPDVSALLTKISTRVADVGISAKTAAIGVAAFMGGFLIADTILGAIPEDMRQIAGVLTASIAAIVAATIAWMAFQGTMTMGVAVPIILAAVGVGIAGVKAAVAMAEGGVVDKPTFALIGEAGPEIVMPLSRYEANRELVSAQTLGETVTKQPDIIYVYVTNYIQTEADYDKASQHTIEVMNEALARRRSS
jgi:hypothetical protein